MPDPRPISALRTVSPDGSEVVQLLEGRRPAVFLDYDGTLTPIVARAEDATIDDGVRGVLRELSGRCPVAIVSGRDLDDVRAMVAVDGIFYAGSHGFDVLDPDGRRTQKGTEYLPWLDAAESHLREQTAAVDGAHVERKRFAVAVHYRAVAPGDVAAVEAAVTTTAAKHDRLRVTGGKKVFELRPDLDWHKGRAVGLLVQQLGLQPGRDVALYIGDDETDEDGFAGLGGDGIGLIVRGEDDARLTAAHLALDDPAAVVALLSTLARSADQE